MALRKYDLFVFDLDGTLIDSAQDIANAANAARGQFGLTPLPLETIKNFVGRGVVRLLKDVFESEDPQIIEQAMALFFKFYDENCLVHTRLYPFAIEMLEMMKPKPLVILTNKPKNFSDKIVSGLGLSKYFKWVLGGDSFSTKKPDPEGLLWITNELKISPKRTLFVGDSAVDFETGRRAEVTTALLAQGFCDRKSLEKLSPDWLFQDVKEMVQWLKTPDPTAV